MLDKRIDILHDYSKGEVYHCHECGKKSKSPLHELSDHKQLCDRCFDRWKSKIVDVVLKMMKFYPISRFNIRLEGKVISIDIQKLKDFKILVEDPEAPKFEGELNS